MSSSVQESPGIQLFVDIAATTICTGVYAGIGALSAYIVAVPIAPVALAFGACAFAFGAANGTKNILNSVGVPKLHSELFALALKIAAVVALSFILINVCAFSVPFTLGLAAMAITMAATFNNSSSSSIPLAS